MKMFSTVIARNTILGAMVMASLVSTGCSKNLIVEFSNHSGRDLEVCSINDSSVMCKSARDGEAVKLVFAAGFFRIADQAGEWHYRADISMLPEEYFPKMGDPMRLIIGQDLALFVLENGMSPDTIGVSQQPDGYPLRPHS